MQAIDSSVRTVSRNFLLLGLGELSARVISFITLVYVARILGAESYGIVGFAAAITLYFSAVADFGIEALGPRDIADKPASIQKLASSVISARLIISAGLAVLLIIAGLFFMRQPDGKVLALYGLTLVGIGGSTRWVHLGLERTGHIAASRVIAELIKALLVFVFVRESRDVAAVPAAQIACDVGAAVLLVVWLRERGYRLRLELDRAVIAPIFRRSWPLVVTTLLGLIVYNSDLVFLRFFRDVEEVGLYLAAFTLITLLGNLGTAYYSSLLPTFVRAGIEPGLQHKLYHTSIAHVLAVSVPLSVGGFLVSSQIISFWFGEAYHISGMVLQILVLSVPFLLLRGVLRVVLITVDREGYIMRVALWAALLNVLLNFLVIPRYGMLGAAWTTVATEVVHLIFLQLYARTEGFPVTGISRIWRTAVATAVMAGVLIIAELPSMWSALLLGGIIYLGALTLSGGVRFRGKVPVLEV